MKLQIKKKKIKVLSSQSNLNRLATPNVAGAGFITHVEFCNGNKTNFNCASNGFEYCTIK
ncbi:hypothetical protein [Pseudoalteromonas sp. R3]|uniref:hypothetical protein n=1 Tax=Pseudoalteromonas sp. R3 TaxID=1709477 RepID=UPI0006B40559|nr:hypothetical protein [Pseudoalteromonas sp. R3]AZZ99360.1 hypothetical protein ELR70_21125 [Pseudoalteromonas sp. R3]